MKRFISLAIALACMICLSSCEKDNISKIEGTWILTEGVLLDGGGIVSTFKSGDLVLTCNPDNTSTLSDGKINLSGSYSAKGSKIYFENIHITYPGSNIKSSEAYIQNQILNWKGTEDVTATAVGVSATKTFSYDLKFKKN